MRSGNVPKSGQIDDALRIRCQPNGDDEEKETDGRERERCRVAQEQKKDKRHKHDRRQVLCNQLCHGPLRDLGLGA
jgi:hypothetical protein